LYFHLWVCWLLVGLVFLRSSSSKRVRMDHFFFFLGVSFLLPLLFPISPPPGFGLGPGSGWSRMFRQSSAFVILLPRGLGRMDNGRFFFSGMDIRGWLFFFFHDDLLAQARHPAAAVAVFVLSYSAILFDTDGVSPPPMGHLEFGLFGGVCWLVQEAL
jgi:hypothetical protein